MMNANEEKINTVNYDGPLSISEGASRRSKKWRNKEILWSELAKRLRKVIRTQESFSEYWKMSTAEKSEVKDCGGFVGGPIKGGTRKAENIANRQILTLDIDNGSEETLDKIKEVLDVYKRQDRSRSSNCGL